MKHKLEAGKIKLVDVLGVRTVVGAGGSVLTIKMAYLGKASSNQRLTRTKRGFGHTVLRHDVRRWMDQLAWTAKTYMKANGMYFSLPVMVTFKLVFPNRRLPDVHNFHKTVLDGLKEGIGIDDRYYLTRDLEEEIIPGCVKQLVITISNGDAGKTGKV